MMATINKKTRSSAKSTHYVVIGNKTVCTVFLQHKYRRVNYVQGNDSHLLRQSKDTNRYLV